MKYPKVSIIILNWNRLRDITECMESVKKLTYPNYNVIIVDNCSTDDSLQRLTVLFPEAIFIKNSKNLGFSGGNNVAIKYAFNSGIQYVWLLNNDTVVEADTLSKLVAYGEKYPEVGLLGPTIYYYNSPQKIQYEGGFLDKNNLCSVYMKPSLANDSDNMVPFLWGTALLIKREVIERIGYLNEKFFAYHEDVEYAIRVANAGYVSSVVSESKIYHKNHGADDEQEKMLPKHRFFYMTRNEYWFWRELLTGFRKIQFLKTYLARVCARVGELKKRGYIDKAIAVIEGAYCAFRNLGGEYDSKCKSPQFINKIILAHPYLLKNLFDLKIF